jgi:peroxiredoxin
MSLWSGVDRAHLAPSIARSTLHPVQEVLALKTFAISALITVLTALSASASEPETPAQHAAIDAAAPDFSLADIHGKKHTLSDCKGKFVVLEWNNWDCPFVKKHYNSHNMQHLQKRYTDKDVVWFTICSSAPGKQGYYGADDLQKKYKSAKSAATAYLVDPDGRVGRLYGAKTTPHMFVIDPEGKLIYAGAIDNKKSTNPKDIEGATNYVEAALDAAMAGKAVKTKSSPPYGCSVKYK